MDTRINAIALVAHPDDCIIFAYSFIYNNPQFNWTIGYLTYTADSERGAELAKFWAARNIDVKFLGFVDDYRDIEKDRVSFDATAAYKAVYILSGQYDLVLTHNVLGEYGHIHHRFVNNAISSTAKHVVTFADVNSGNVKYHVPMSAYSLDELPTHGDIIQGFHSKDHKNDYLVSEHTLNIINQIGIKQ